MTTTLNNPPPAAPETLDGGAVLHRLRLPEHDEPIENIARGCALALPAMAAILFELEGELDWLHDDLPRIDDDDGETRGYYERKICNYESATCTLAEAQRVLEELADSCRGTASVGDFAEICARIARALGNPT
jgi:hypothetical protein